MKTMIETKSGLYFDLDELAAVKVCEDKEYKDAWDVYVWFKGNGCPMVAGEFDDEKSAQIYRDLIIKEWIGDEDA